MQDSLKRDPPVPQLAVVNVVVTESMDLQVHLAHNEQAWGGWLVVPMIGA